jgi:hypothetical protein
MKRYISLEIRPIREEMTMKSTKLLSPKAVALPLKTLKKQLRN